MSGTVCQFCNHQTSIIPANFHGKHVDCPCCGEYRIASSALQDAFNGLKLHLISAYIRKQNDLGEIPSIFTYDEQKFSELQEIPLAQKIDLLLMHFAKDLTTYTDAIKISPKYIAKISAKNEQEYQFIVGILLDKQYLTQKSGGVLYISAEGWIKYESLQMNTDSRQGFVAMWFHKRMDEVYEDAIKPAINDLKYDAFRVDKKEHNNKIDDEIIMEIQRSRFVVADFTGHRGGVYFESGYALGKGIPVIWTCCEKSIKNLHFDIRQYNSVIWNSKEELKDRLYKRIGALIGENK